MSSYDHAVTAGGPLTPRLSRKVSRRYPSNRDSLRRTFAEHSSNPGRGNDRHEPSTSNTMMVALNCEGVTWSATQVSHATRVTTESRVTRCKAGFEREERYLLHRSASRCAALASD